MVNNVSYNRAIKASWCIMTGRVGLQFDAVCTAYSGKIDVQLAMAEYLVGQVQTNIVQCLRLCFIRRHTVTQSDWKLSTAKCE